MEFTFNIKGFLTLECDRCLDHYRQDIDYTGSLLVKFQHLEELPGKEKEIADNIIFMDPEEYEIDLKHYIYENIALSLPVRRIHPLIDGKRHCNENMLKYIANANDEEENDEEDYYNFFND